MSEEPKKKDAVADALAALAAGEHVEEAPLSGSGMAGESDHVQLTPGPVPPAVPPQAPPRPPAITAVPPAVGGGQLKARPAGGKSVVPTGKAAAGSNTPAAGRPDSGAARPGGSGTATGKPIPAPPAARRPSNPGAPAAPLPPAGRPPTPG